MFYAAVNAKQTPAFLRNACCVPCVTPLPRRQRDQVAPFVTFDSTARLKNDTGIRERKTQSTQNNHHTFSRQAGASARRRRPRPFTLSMGEKRLTGRHGPHGRSRARKPHPLRCSWAVRRNKGGGSGAQKQRKLSQGNRKKRQYRPVCGKRATKPSALAHKQATNPDQRAFREEQISERRDLKGALGAAPLP